MVYNIKTMMRKGVSADTIIVLTLYTAQQRLLRKIFRSMSLKIQMSTVNGFQGDQHTICILDLVIKDGLGHSIRFTRDMPRMNVGLSRAKNELVVAGCKGMTDKQHDSKGVQA